MDLVDITIYYLEMLERPERNLPAPREGLSVLHAKTPTVSYYRYLYNAVGEDYRWLSRRKLSDEQLAEIIQHPLDEVYVLHVEGTPAGFAELDRRTAYEVELVQFGLIPDFHGQGLGKWFLQWVVETVWSSHPKRFWLHTCTLDHPAALPMYQKAGFVEYNQEHVRREW